MGTPEIEGIENISDDRIFEIYKEVEDIMYDIAYDIAKAQGTISVFDNVLREMVQIALIGEINGEYSNNLKMVKLNVSASWSK